MSTYYIYEYALNYVLWIVFVLENIKHKYVMKQVNSRWEVSNMDHETVGVTND